MTEQNRKTQTIEWIVTGIAMLLGMYNQIAITKGWVHIEIGDIQLTQYVTWFYELIVGAIAFWRNNNITSFAQLTQAVLNALKNGTLQPNQVEALLNSEELRQIADAHSKGQLVNVNIEEGSND